MTEYLYDAISVILISDFGVFLLVAASFFSSFLLIPITGVLLTGASIGIGLDAIYYVVLPSLIGSITFLSTNFLKNKINNKRLTKIYNKILRSKKSENFIITWDAVLIIRLSSCMPLPFLNLLTHICDANLYVKSALVIFGTGVPSIFYCYLIKEVVSKITEYENIEEILVQLNQDLIVSSVILLSFFLFAKFVKRRFIN